MFNLPSLAHLADAVPHIAKAVTVAESLAPIAERLAADAISAATNPSIGIAKFAEDLISNWPLIVEAVRSGTAAADEVVDAFTGDDESAEAEQAPSDEPR